MGFGTFFYSAPQISAPHGLYTQILEKINQKFSPSRRTPPDPLHPSSIHPPTKKKILETPSKHRTSSKIPNHHPRYQNVSALIYLHATLRHVAELVMCPVFPSMQFGQFTQGETQESYLAPSPGAQPYVVVFLNVEN